MNGKGKYPDTILAERLWRSIKYEEVYLQASQSVARTRIGIDAYPESYNQERPHQAMGYWTPADVYQNGQQGKKLQEAGLRWGLVRPSQGARDSPDLALRLS